MKIVSIVGARPQFVKAAVISRAILKFNSQHDKYIEEIIVHTGQHFDDNMSKIFFEELSIPESKYDLGISSLSHGSMTGRMIEQIEGVLLKEKPDWVIIYGDTNSTLAGVLAAKKLDVKIAHIEAGLRSNNIRMPEEQNRLVADRLSDILFCPTLKAFENLKRENIENSAYGQKAFVVGDVMNDALMFYTAKVDNNSTCIDNLGLEKSEFILSTVHRAENINDIICLENIFSALSLLATEIDVILPLHPGTRKMVEKFEIDTGNIKIIEPVSYLEMIALEKNCKLIITDSGGIQKEAYFFKKPCITMRDETEWTELIEVKANVLTGAFKDKILSAYNSFKLVSFDVFKNNFYGDGDAGDKAVQELIKE